METNQQLQYLSKPIGYSETTGLDVYESYTAKSGFNYLVGIRSINDLVIMEQVAEGTANTLLCGILIYSKSDRVLLSEISVPKSTPYSRNIVVEIVKDTLLNLLETSVSESGDQLDLNAAEKQLNDMLDTCYFEKSRAAIINWAKSQGLIKN